jgi:hypothetical protein
MIYNIEIVRAFGADLDFRFVWYIGCRYGHKKVSDIIIRTTSFLIFNAPFTRPSPLFQWERKFSYSVLKKVTVQLRKILRSLQTMQ